MVPVRFAGVLGVGQMLSDELPGRIYVYRWVPDYADPTIRPGDYVLLDPQEGRHYGGKKGKRLTARVDTRLLEYRQNDEFVYRGDSPMRAHVDNPTATGKAKYTGDRCDGMPAELVGWLVDHSQEVPYKVFAKNVDVRSFGVGPLTKCFHCTFLKTTLPSGGEAWVLQWSGFEHLALREPDQFDYQAESDLAWQHELSPTGEPVVWLDDQPMIEALGGIDEMGRFEVAWSRQGRWDPEAYRFTAVPSAWFVPRSVVEATGLTPTKHRRGYSKDNPTDPIRDESFEWVHPAVRGEIDDAVDRALASGATPPLSYAGAGQYGIVICDSQGKAYKVARGEKGRWPQRPSAQSLRDEEAWFRFAAKLPAIRSHVAKVYGYDDDNDVLIRECVQAIENRRLDYSGKRGERLRELYATLQDVMREYGFRRPEFKEDSFVYHPKRGPVLVDAGFASRDIGWSNARRAQALLKGAKPRSEWETGAVVHGLRMDAGDELPADVANNLADRLEATYMQNPTRFERHTPVKAPNYSYHVTFYNRLETIANRGLVPVEAMRPGASSLGRGGYAGSSAGKVFLTEKAGVGFWYDKAEQAANDMSDDPLTEGFVPVVLRTPSPKGKRKDEAGSSDSTYKAWYVKQKIPATAIEVWDGGGWLPVEDWREVDVLQAVNMSADGDDYSFRYDYDNPLSQIDPSPPSAPRRITDRTLPGYSR